MNDKGRYRYYNVGVGYAQGDITSGPDGNLWFTGIYTNTIGRITPAGTVKEFPIPTPDSRPTYIVSGPDGNLWFTEREKRKDRPDHAQGGNSRVPPSDREVFSRAHYGRAGWQSLVRRGSCRARVGCITPMGVLKEYTGLNAYSGMIGITLGPDKNLWAACAGNHMIARITPKGEFKTFPTPDAEPFNITTGKDGNLWFTDYKHSKIGRITPEGDISYFDPPTPIPERMRSRPVRTGISGLWRIRQRRSDASTSLY